MKNPFNNESKKFNFTLERIMMMSILGLLVISISKREMNNIQLKNIPFIDNQTAQDDFCKWSMQRLIEMKPISETLTSDIYYIFKNTENPLKLSPTDKIIFLNVKDDTCKMLLKGTDGELRSLLFNLVKDHKYPFYFKIDNISDEIPSTELYEKHANTEEI
jgi:hypothetical protein